MTGDKKAKIKAPSGKQHLASNSFVNLRKITEGLPLSPGVYLMKDASGTILYIGKAKALKKRVRSYLTEQGIPKIRVLMSAVHSIDYITTPSEVDALLLEAHLIKKYQPRYNKELKDDKSFPLLKITAEKFPRLCITRQKSDKKAVYYGPYTDAKLLRQAVSLINSLFPIRKCQNMPKTACLYYHIHQCIAPCIKPEVKSEYDHLVSEIKRFLGGGKKSFLEYLTNRMDAASKALRFEDAQFFKEQIEALGRLKKKRFFPRRPEDGMGLSATLELKHALKMKALPVRIVCFDVSNIQGDEAVASKVSFYRELPDKLHYRRYRIKNIKGINDYAMIAQALTRMLRGIKDGREAFIPDLIMIDGGKGHLNTAVKVLRAEGMETIGVIAIAKRFEHIFTPMFKDPLIFSSDSPAIHLLEKVRDEAHRFAIRYHHALKEKSVERSVLDGIPGIGPKRKRILLETFGSIGHLKQASFSQLTAISGIDHKAAKRIRAFFNPA